MKLKAGTLEERIIKVLEERYPITVGDLIKALHERPDRVNLALKRLESKGIIVLEPLPPVTYIRLVKRVGFVGLDRKQRRPLKHKHEKVQKSGGKGDEDVDYIL